VFLKKFNTKLGYIAGLLILATAVVTMYDVVARYFFNSPSLYIPFISAFLILGAIFIGTSWAMQAGGHVFVEIVTDKLKPLPRKICFTIGYAFAMFFVGHLFNACFGFAQIAVANNWKAQGNLPIPSVILYGVMSFGTAMLFITLIMKAIETWRPKTDNDIIIAKLVEERKKDESEVIASE